MPIQTPVQEFIALLFIIAPKWKQLKCPSTYECINKCGIRIMEYYSARKRNEVHATSRMSLGSIMLSLKKKPHTKGHRMYDSIDMKCPE